MWHDPSFYLTISFGVFLFLFGRPFYKRLKNSLKSYRQGIHLQMENLNSLYAEAQAVLAEKQKQLTLLESKITLLEEEAKERVFSIQQERDKALSHLEELFAQELKLEKENMKQDFQKLIQKELIEKSYKNATWILENKLTKSQKEEIISSAIEKL